jgi:ATP-dependent Clp protease protease subunit
MLKLGLGLLAGIAVLGTGVIAGTSFKSNNGFEIKNATNVDIPSSKEADSSGQDFARPSVNVKTEYKNVLLLNQEIDDFSVDPVIQELKRLDGTKEPIYLLLDSPGGSVFSGTKLVTQIESMKSKVNTVCIGLCASMAAMIHSYGNQRYMTNRSVLMYHPASGGFMGTLEIVQSRLNMITNIVGELEYNVQRRAKLDRDWYNVHKATELWATTSLAKKLNLVDAIIAINVPTPQEDEAEAKGRAPAGRRRLRNGFVITGDKLDFNWIYEGVVKPRQELDTKETK